MRITLIGMSGSGKSFWSSALARHGFHYLGCDREIGRRLVEEGRLSAGSLDLIGNWMGFPFDAAYPRREALYLGHEKAVMDRLLTELESRPPDHGSPPVVIDTTGSVIYTGEAIRQRLRQQTVVVYLSTSPDYRQALHRAYVKNPRPVLWQQHFRKNHGEDDQTALKRCYADLLADRESRYRHYAHLEICWDPVIDTAPEVDTILAPVKAFLARQRSSHAL
jgi:shikimate kinase